MLRKGKKDNYAGLGVSASLGVCIFGGMLSQSYTRYDSGKVDFILVVGFVLISDSTFV